MRVSASGKPWAQASKYGNVFILCTGRCGSTTFARACSHISNFSSGHETRARVVGRGRLDYPRRHIEADNRLTWLLGRLDAEYGDDAFYVLLTRDRNAVAESFSQRAQMPESIALAYRNSVLMNPGKPTLETCHDLIDTVTANVRSFLKDKTHWMDFRMETAARDFPAFWRRIGAEGDFDAAMAEWSTLHNASWRPEPVGFRGRLKNALRRAVRDPLRKTAGLIR
jgi:hypothetical protein